MRKDESLFGGFFARTRCDLVAQWLQLQIQRFKFFGLDARRDRFTGRLSGGLAEDIAMVTCRLQLDAGSMASQGNKWELLELLYVSHFG